jgi:uncharacterized alkaline shock family protein YloU
MSEQFPAPRPAQDGPPPTQQQWSTDQVRQQASEFADRAGEALDKASDAVGEFAERAADATMEAASNVVSRIRNNATLPAERGKTTIRNEVVEKIAGIAAREVPGVYDLGGDVARIFSSVRERIGLGESEKDQGVKVKLEGKQADLTVTIVIEFGFVVLSVTDKVREKVISAVESMLGLEVSEVDVIVDDVHVPEGSDQNDKERAAGYSAETKAIVVGG